LYTLIPFVDPFAERRYQPFRHTTVHAVLSFLSKWCVDGNSA
jgi:hypothetical protein